MHGDYFFALLILNVACKLWNVVIFQVMQKLGKADETKDLAFEEGVINFNKQLVRNHNSLHNIISFPLVTVYYFRHCPLSSFFCHYLHFTFMFTWFPLVGRRHQAAERPEGLFGCCERYFHYIQVSCFELWVIIHYGCIVPSPLLFSLLFNSDARVLQTCAGVPSWYVWTGVVRQRWNGLCRRGYCFIYFFSL